MKPMARNLHGVIWTRISGQPEKMGDLVLTSEMASFTYTREYLDSGQPGFCLLGDGAIWGADSVTYPVSERIPVFPRLLALIPGNNPRNLQRRHYLDLLRTQTGREPPPGMETEWRLLLMGGHGGVGHVDIFADDLAAEQWYRHQPGASSQTEGNGQSQLWRMIKRNVLDENLDFDPQIIEQTLGPTPSVGGMIPKLLVALEPDTAPLRFHPPDTPGMTNVVLKIEPPEYTGLLDLEALCLDIHRQAGFDVPAWRRIDQGGLRFLAVERFDENGEIPIPMESLFSVIATGDHQFRETGDIMLDELGGILERLATIATLEEGASEHLYRRLLMALLTGNGDLHLDNLAFLGGLDDCRWTPVYDPAPMRAWPRHNLVSAIPFDASQYEDHAAFFIDMGGSFSLSDAQIRHCVQAALDATEDYAAQVVALKQVPEQQRWQLREIARQERALLKNQVT